MIRVSYARKESGSSQNWVYGEMVSRLTVNQLFRVRPPVDPRGFPTPPYGTRSVKPGKWGLYMVIVAELVKRLIVVQEIVGSTPTFHT